MVVLNDLDKFQALNDNHGHSPDDRALVDVAHALRSGCRDIAAITRGGWGRVHHRPPPPPPRTKLKAMVATHVATTAR